MTPDFSNRSWGRAIVHGLHSLGAGRFFISPGARGSALVAAVAESGLDATVHYDERGMAFAALGWSMATGRPVVCLTTSGSAVANLLPACVEAFHSHVPLIFVTADRPPELRGSGANQTIHQPGLFGSFVHASVDLPCPGDFRALPDILRKLCECGGPVHLNVPFAEPLLSDDGGVEFSLPEKVERIADEVSAEAPGGFFESPRGVVLIGRLPLEEQGLGPLILEFADRLGWPVFADVLSGSRFLEGVVGHADWILQRDDIPAPGRVLHFGGSLVSKRLGAWIAKCRREHHVQVRKFPERLDPWSANPVVIRAGIEGFLEANTLKPRAGWKSLWSAANQSVGGVLSGVLAGDGLLTEPGIARIVASSSGSLFLGNSMPVRDVDSCAVANFFGSGVIFGNRGASGIDGNIATLAGACLGSARPMTGLLGDLAVLHDLNSLALLRDLPVTLVVVNNDGGGIFRFLPLAIDAENRERFWETPHGMDFRHAAAQFGLEYHQPNTASELTSFLERSSQKSCLIECRTDRAANRVLHLEMARKVKSLEMTWSD
jgi:2-succinyl-5-enolpyruvyl-6-hydroxy-3-cyclohexene-1-carboxylate synthase